MEANAAPNKKVPVTIITGYLGAGKTTLVRHILTSPHGLKIAVIVNEFGEELGIESALLVDPEGNAHPDWYEVGNGCLCCTVRDDLVVTIERILERDPTFDHILVETTGLADPGPIAEAFWVDDALESPVFLDGIITLVDSYHILRQLQMEPESEGGPNEAKRQIAFADVVVLNKSDLVKSDDMDRITETIKAINTQAKQISCAQSNIPLRDILQLQSLQKLDWLSDNQTQHQQHQHQQHQHHQHQHTDEGDCIVCKPIHDPQVHTCSVEMSKGPLDRSRFEEFWANLLWERKQEAQIYRAKGILYLADEPQKRFMLQSVQELYEIRPMGEWLSAPPHSKIILIGRQVRNLQLVNELEELVANPV